MKFVLEKSGQAPKALRVEVLLSRAFEDLHPQLFCIPHDRAAIGLRRAKETHLSSFPWKWLVHFHSSILGQRFTPVPHFAKFETTEVAVAETDGKVALNAVESAPGARATHAAGVRKVRLENCSLGQAVARCRKASVLGGLLTMPVAVLWKHNSGLRR